MTDKDPRYEVDNPTMKQVMTQIAGFIAGLLPKEWGFGLFIFEFKGESFFWISDANRADMIKALREFIRKEEGN